MAQQVDEKEEKTEDFSKYYDDAAEMEKIKEALEWATVEVDKSTGKELGNEDNVWTVHNTKDANVEVVYRLVNADLGVYTIRGSTTLNISVDEMYDFMNCSYDGEQEFIHKIDKQQKEWKLIKTLGDDHRCCYISFDAGFPTWLISHRDFCWMKRRAKYDEYTVKKGDVEEKWKIAISVLYSIDENHPCYVEPAKSHVRGIIHTSAYIYMQKVNATEEEQKQCRFVYLVSVDPCGSIPQRVINYSAPEQGMMAKKFLDNQDAVREEINKIRQAQQQKANA